MSWDSLPARIPSAVQNAFVLVQNYGARDNQAIHVCLGAGKEDVDARHRPVVNTACAKQAAVTGQGEEGVDLYTAMRGRWIG
jgi:hypothetical protein